MSKRNQASDDGLTTWYFWRWRKEKEMRRVSRRSMFRCQRLVVTSKIDFTANFGRKCDEWTIKNCKFIVISLTDIVIVAPHAPSPRHRWIKYKNTNSNELALVCCKMSKDLTARRPRRPLVIVGLTFMTGFSIFYRCSRQSTDSDFAVYDAMIVICGRQCTYLNFRNANLRTQHVAFSHLHGRQMIYDEWISKRSNATGNGSVNDSYEFVVAREINPKYQIKFIRKVKPNRKWCVCVLCLVVAVFMAIRCPELQISHRRCAFTPRRAQTRFVSHLNTISNTLKPFGVHWTDTSLEPMYSIRLNLST